MKTIEYYLMPKSGYEGTYERKEGHYMVKTGTIADMIHDSKMLWGYDFNKTIPSLIELNKILKEGVYPRLVEWDPIEIDEYEYDEIVQQLISIQLEKPYRVS